MPKKRKYYSRRTLNRHNRILQQHLRAAKNKPIVSYQDMAGKTDINPFSVTSKNNATVRKPINLGSSEVLTVIRKNFK